MAAARAGAECAPMSASRVWISAMRCGSLAVSASASRALRSTIGGEHELDQAFGPVRRLLRQPAEALARAMRHPPVLGGDVADDDMEQGGLAGTVAADQADMGAFGNARRGIVDQKASGNADREVFDDEHSAVLPSYNRAGKRGRSCVAEAIRFMFEQAPRRPAATS